MWEDMETDPAFLERDACRKAGKPVEIARTKRLILRETVLGDVPELYRIGKEPGMETYLKPMQPTLEEETEFMEAYIHFAYSFYDFGLWTILEQKTGRVVGRAGLFPSEILNDAVEMGYMIASECQRQGYARESAEAVLWYAFKVLELPEVHLLADMQNEASLRTARALGPAGSAMIRQEGRELVHFLFPCAMSRVP